MIQMYYEHCETKEVAWKIPEGREFRARVSVVAGGGATSLAGAKAAASAAAAASEAQALADGGAPTVDVHDDGPLARLRQLAHLRGSDSDDSDSDDGAVVVAPPQSDLRLPGAV